MGFGSPIIRCFVINFMQENEPIYHQDSTADYPDFRYSFPDYPVTQKDTVVSIEPGFIPTTEKVPEKQKLQDSVFIVFLFCFIVMTRILSTQARIFLSLPDELFGSKNRKNILPDPVGYKQYVKILLFSQTLIILSLFSYAVLSNHPEIRENFIISNFYESTSKTYLLLILFFIYKWISYNIAGSIFFLEEAFSQWINNFTSLICVLGIFIFIPVLLMYYVAWMYSFCYFFTLFCLGIVLIIIFHRTYVLFFHNIFRLHYLFLYLCAQEIAPLLILYKGLIYLT